MKHDVFISFSFRDQNAAENLVNYLTGHYGITCWICTRDLDGGSQFKAQIPDAIDSAQIVVFIQSRSSIESREVPKEIGIAFDSEKTIIPFKLDETPLKAELRYDLYGVEYIDATVPSFEERAEELAQSILKALGRDRISGARIDTKPIYELMPTPFSCSEIFFGRDAEMAQLHRAFDERNTVILRGMGGIGKSEFVRQYTRRYRSDYDRVIFARYEGSILELLANDAVFQVRGLARKVNDDGTQQSDESYASVKLDIIRKISNERTLIILDNFDVLDDPMLEAFANGNSYRLIITSRMEPSHGKYYCLPIMEMDEDTLRDMVIEFANPQTTMIDHDDPDFPELFAITNRHTLTLELIGNFMEEQCIDEIGEMIALLKKHSIDILDQSEGSGRVSAISNLFRMTEMSENEQNFLRWLALTPADGIGHKLFKQWVDQETFGARTRLAALSLIRLDGVSKKISLHPIVRQTVYSELKATIENSKSFLENIRKSVFESWNWPLSQKLMVAESSEVIMGQFGELTEDNFELYYTFGINRNFVLPKERVLPFWERLYRFAIEHYGEDDLRAGLVSYRAGWFCQYCDIQAMQMWLEERAYPNLKKNRNLAPVEFPHTVTNIATCYRKLHDGDPRPEYLEKSMHYCEEALLEMTRSHDEAAASGNENVERRTYIMTGGVYMVKAQLGLKTDNDVYTEAAIKEIERRITPDMITDYAFLSVLKGRYHLKKGEADKAIEMYQTALDSYNTAFPEINNYAMEIHVEMARCEEMLGNNEAAHAHWEASYRIADVLLVEKHHILKMVREALHIS